MTGEDILKELEMFDLMSSGSVSQRQENYDIASAYANTDASLAGTKEIKKKGMQYPFLYVNYISALEYSTIKKDKTPDADLNDNKITLFLRQNNTYKMIANLKCSLKDLLLLRVFNPEKEIHVKTSKETEIPFDDFCLQYLMGA